MKFHWPRGKYIGIKGWLGDVKMKFHWPRGKYNGYRIQGFRISFIVHVLWWNWKPILKWNFGEPYFIWLIFSVRGYCEFCMSEKRGKS